MSCARPAPRPSTPLAIARVSRTHADGNAAESGGSAVGGGGQSTVTLSFAPLMFALQCSAWAVRTGPAAKW